MIDLNELEDNLQNTQSEIHDSLNAMKLNFEIFKMLMNNYKNKNQFRKQQNEKIADKIELQIESLIKDFASRKQYFSRFLIQKQIYNQDQEISKDILHEYQYRILELRRNADDKESSFETLLRPTQKKNLRLSQEWSQTKQIQKYRLLLEQIDEAKQFVQKFKFINDPPIASNLNTRQILQSLINKKQEPINIFTRNMKSLNTSMLLNYSDRNNTQIRNMSDDLQNQEQRNLKGSSVSQRSFNLLKMTKQAVINRTEKRYENKKRQNTFPLPFNLAQTKISNQSISEQQKQQKKQIKNIQELRLKILDQKQQNQTKKQLLNQKQKQFSCLKTILKEKQLLYQRINVQKNKQNIVKSNYRFRQNVLTSSLN